MRKSIATGSLVVLAALGVSACGNSIDDLAGNWGTAPIPSGGGIEMRLSSADSHVSGTGQVCGVGPRCSPGAVTITGNPGSAGFYLAFHGDSGFAATFSGHLISQTELRGTWIDPTESYTISFYRE